MIRNLDFLRNIPEWGGRLYEALEDLNAQHQSIAQQVNGNSTGQPLPPPAIDSLTVTGQNGHFHAQIQHNAEFYRGIKYHLEYADNASFHNPRAVDIGSSREHTMFLGNGTYYFRAFAAYESSPPGPPAYHGGAHSPQPVSGGGSIGGPAFLPPQGSGTGKPGEGLSGPGPIPFRTSSGRPPVRGQSQTSGGSAGGSLLPGPSTGLPPGASFAIASGGAPVTGFRFLTSTQSGLSGIAAGLGVLDANQVLVWVSDYDHILRWTGSAWSMIGDRAAYIRGFLADPNPTTGWHLCDGSVVSYLNSDGSLTTGYTLPNLVGGGDAAFLLFGATASVTLNPAVAPTLAMNSYTPAGTVSQPTFTGTPATPTGTVSAPVFTGTPGTTGNNSAALTVQSGAGATVAANTHTHPFTPAGTVSAPVFSGNSMTPAGTVSQPTFTGTPATLTGTISNTGTPQSIELRPWFRL